MSLLLLAANIAIVPLLSPHNDTDINPENKERSVYRSVWGSVTFGVDPDPWICISAVTNGSGSNSGSDSSFLH
jgi:hypothetical protein